MRRVLFLSGLDPTGAAGILMDTRVASFLGVNSAGITTCLVVENSFKVEKVISVKESDFKSLLTIVLEESPVSATKIGLIPQESLSWFANLILEFRGKLGKIVVDPIIMASSGYSFQKTISKDFKKLISLADVVTPNYYEVQKIVGRNLPPENAGKKLLELGMKAVIVTGHEIEKSKLRDYLILRSGTYYYESIYIPKKVRGTGCALSSAVACFLATGTSIKDAFFKAVEMVKKGIQQSETISGDIYLLRFDKQKELTN